MIVGNFEISPRYAAQGERVKIRFTLKVERGDEVFGLRIWARFPEVSGEYLWYKDDGYALAAGKTANLELEAVIPYMPDAENILGTQRFISTEYFGIQMGPYGTRTDTIYAFDLLDRKYIPAITLFNAERYTNGMPDDEGEQLRLKLAISTGTQPKLNVLKLLLYAQQDGSITDETPSLDFSANVQNWLAGGEIVFDLPESLVFDKNSDWTLGLVFGDGYESVTLIIEVPMAFANLHLSGNPKGGAAFGGFHKELYDAEGKYVPTLDSHYLIRPFAGIEGVTGCAAGEAKTGYTWLDGKPIFRFAATGKTSLVGVQAAIATLPSAADVMISLRGMLKTPSGWKPVPYAYYADMGWNSALYHVEATNEIILSVGREYTGEKDYIIIAEYTKKEEE